MAKRPSKEIENDFTDFVENQSRNERKIIEAHIPTNLTVKMVGKNESQKQLINSIKNNDITICSGQAGSGKTYLSVGYALNLIRKTSTNYKKIYFVKSVIPLKGEEIGFLKGDYMEKIEPYMQSYYMNLEKFISKQSMNVLLAEEIIKPFPVAFMRGVTIDDSIVIVDECVSGKSQIYIKINDEDKPKLINIENLYSYFLKYDNVYILSYNHEEYVKEYKKVNSISITNNVDTYKINLNNNNFDCSVVATKNHPFAVYENGKIIYKELEKLKINDILLKRKNKPGNHSIMNEKNYDLLLGFVLGDGSLQKNKQWNENIFRLRKNHSLKQEEYCKFCAELYRTPINNNYKSGFTGEHQCSFQTKSYYIDKNFIKSCYREKKYISKDIYNYITKRTLALWYMDDGSINKYNENGSNITLHTEGFTKIENEVLRDILIEKFGIYSTVFGYRKKRTKNNGDEYSTSYFCLRINKENSEKLQDLIKEYIHPSMYYKLREKYVGYFNKELYYEFNDDYENTTLEVKSIEFNDNERVYNMEVDGNHNYYVDNILTHNCQNLQLTNIQTIMTRISSSSKMIILGDTNQIDLKNKSESSLGHLLNLFDKTVKGINVVRMNDADDNIRNPIIKDIERVFNNHNTKKK